MAVKFPFGFHITGENEPIDTRLVLTEAELRIAHKSTSGFCMPDHYLAVCSTDDRLYIYDKNNEETTTTGKFRMLKSAIPVSDDATIDVTVDSLDDTKYILSIKGKDGAVDNAVLRKHIDTSGNTTYSWDVIYDKNQIDTLLNNKVDKESGKSLISETDLTKLNGIATGATKVESFSENGKIKINGESTTVYTLPTDVVQDSEYVHTDTNFSDSLNTKLLGIESGAEVNKVNDVKVNFNSESPASVVNDKVAVIDLSSKQDKLTQDNKLSFNYIEETATCKFYTDDDKTKLAGVEAGAEVNKLTDVQLNNASVVTNKVAKFTIETGLAADSSNPATATAIRAFVNDSIAKNGAAYVTSSSSGDNFSSRNALINAAHYYYNGTEYSLKNNDYAIVAADETHNNKQARYLYTLTTTGGSWSYQYSLGNTFTVEQEAALNSGVTSAHITKLGNIADYANHVSVTNEKTGTIEIDNTTKTIIPDNLVIDNNYKHITVSGTYVTDGSTTFNKYDDTALANRVTSTETKITSAETNISNLQTTVGNSSSGLVKGLADEISRATGVEEGLADRVANLEARGRFLSTWNAAQGKPGSYPETPEGTVFPQIYIYKSGDYYIVSEIGTTNKKPSGTSITKASATEQWVVGSEEVAAGIEVGVGDYFLYDGTNWIWTQNSTKTVNFAAISGEVRDNAKLKTEFEAIESALSTKVEKTTTIAGVNLQDNITKAELQTALNVADGAQVNSIEKVKLNGTELPITDKAVNVEINLEPYAKTADVTTELNKKQPTIDETHKLSYSLLSDTPAIPIKTSDLENDSRFVAPQSQTATSAGKYLKSIEVTNGISSDWGDVTMDRNFTTKVAVGNLAAGTEISSSTTLKDLLYAILCNKTLLRIEVDDTSAKKSYLIGEAFDKDTITVTAIYQDSTGESSQVLSKDEYSVSALTYNTTQVTVSYAGKSATINDIVMNAKITCNFVKCSSESSTETTVKVADGYTSSVIVPDTYYELTNSSLSITGECTSSITTNNKVSIQNIKSNITYTVTASAIQYTPTSNITNGTCEWSSSSYTAETASGYVVIKPNDLFTYPTNVTITNATLISYNSNNGQATFNNICGAVNVTATCNAASITALTLITSSAKSSYVVGEALSLNNVIAKLTYADTKASTVEVAYPWATQGYMLAADPDDGHVFTESEIGTVNVVVSGYNLSSSYPVTVSNKTITSIEVATQPTKLEYTSETLDLSGLKIKVNYDDSTSKTIDYTECTCTPASGATIVTADNLDNYVNVLISYEGKSVTLANKIKVIKTLTNLTHTGGPTATTYSQGQSIDLTGLKYTAVFNNITTGVEIPYTSCTCTPANGTRLTTAGTDQTISAKYTFTSTFGNISTITNTTAKYTVNTVNYSLLATVTNGSAAKVESAWIYNDTGTIQLTANDGYDLPITVEDATFTNATYDSYNSSTGTISIKNIVGNVTITGIVCPQHSEYITIYTGGAGSKYANPKISELSSLTAEQVLEESLIGQHLWTITSSGKKACFVVPTDYTISAWSSDDEGEYPVTYAKLTDTTCNFYYTTTVVAGTTDNYITISKE